MLTIGRLVALLVLTSCAASQPVYDYEGEPPAVSPSSVAPLPPFPLVLVPTSGLLVYRGLCNLVEEGCARWNGALGEVVFLQAGNGRVISTDIMNSRPSGVGVAIGEVDNLTSPHRMALWVGILPPTDRAVVLHELGHLLGIAHSDASDDVMYYRNGFATDLSPNDVHRGRIAVAFRRQQNRTTP